jgi:endonuclease YncB( thermonuclease family)
MIRISRRRSTTGVFALLFLFAAISPSLSAARFGAARQESPACAPDKGAGVRVVAVEKDFELLLADGRRVWPAGIDPPAMTRDDPQFGEHGRQALAAQLVGSTILGAPAVAAPDRWGRIAGPLFVSTSAEAAPADVAAMIVAAGWARVRPSAAASACLPALLRAEATARRAGLGLWTDPSYAVLAANAPASFAGRFGTLQIVEGRVTSMGESGPRTYLNFGPRRGVDFAVVVARQNRKAFDKAGMPLQGLLGGRIRVRGLLDKGSGPQIEISGPDWLEIIEGT